MGNFFEKIFTPLVHIQNDQRVMGIILRYVCWGTHRPPPPPGGPAADRPTRRPPRFRSTKGGGRAPPPPLQPPKLSHTPRGHALAGGGPHGATRNLLRGGGGRRTFEPWEAGGAENGLPSPRVNFVGFNACTTISTAFERLKVCRVMKLLMWRKVFLMMGPPLMMMMTTCFLVCVIAGTCQRATIL